MIHSRCVSTDPEKVAVVERVRDGKRKKRIKKTVQGRFHGREGGNTEERGERERGRRKEGREGRRERRDDGRRKDR